MTSRQIPKEVIQQINDHYGIVDLVGQYVKLKKSGRNYTGLCPFHSEKSPSFSVSPDKKVYHCFGCGAGGDVIQFTMDIENMTFYEAITHLAKDAGIALPSVEVKAYQDPNEEKKQQLIEAHEVASKLFHYLLLETEHGKEPLKYLLNRGFTRELIETFRIGYTPNNWDTLLNFLNKRGFSIDILVQAGLVVQSDDGKHYDRFRNRVMFPITDAQGRVVAFGGRIIDEGSPKYLNSPESLIFNKSRLLFNFFNARKAIRKDRKVILLEGYVDTISIWNAGVHYGVATLGTSLTEEQAKILCRNADEIIISYDSDDAGQKATYRAIEVLEQTDQVTIRIAQYPKGLDPDDYIQKYGKEAFIKDILQSTKTATAFKLAYIRKNYNLQDQTDRMKYLTNAIQVIADLKLSIEREHYLKELSKEFQISFESLKQDLNKNFFKKQKKNQVTRDNLPSKWNNIINNGNHAFDVKTLPTAHYNAEKHLLLLMMKDEEIAEKVKEEIGSEFHVEDFAVLAAYIYSYYGNGNEADINHFISLLDDEYYIRLATKIAMIDINEEISEKQVNDYISMVKKYNLNLEIHKLKEEQQRAIRMEEPIKAAEIGAKIIQLQTQMKYK